MTDQPGISTIENSGAPRQPVKPLQRLRGCLFLLAGLIIIAALLCVFHRPILTGFTNMWGIDEPIEKSDAILVLGGGAETRPFAAAKLYHQGFAKKILVTRLSPTPTNKLGIGIEHGDLNRQILIHEGVSEEAILMIGNDVKNTYQEALALHDWIKTSGAKRIIIPTEFMHTRRTRWLFDKILKDTGTDTIVTSLNSYDYTRDDWWQSEIGVLAVQNEVLKYLYYRLKY